MSTIEDDKNVEIKKMQKEFEDMLKFYKSAGMSASEIVEMRKEFEKELDAFKSLTPEEIQADKKQQETIKQMEVMFNCLRDQGMKEAIKYFTVSKTTQTEPFTDIQQNVNYAFIFAAGYGMFDHVKFLLTSPKIEKHADIHFFDDSAIQKACEIGSLDMIKYLLESPELKEHAPLPKDMTTVFNSLAYYTMNATASSAPYINSMEYLSKNPEVHYTNEIEKVFKSNFPAGTENFYEPILERLRMNKLNAELHENLQGKKEAQNKSKL